MMPRRHEYSPGERLVIALCIIGAVVLAALMLTQVGCASLPIKAPDGWTPQPDAPVAELHIVVGEQYVAVDGVAHLSVLFAGEIKGTPAAIELTAQRVGDEWSGSLCTSSLVTLWMTVCVDLSADGVAVDLDRMVREVPARTPMDGP